MIDESQGEQEHSGHVWLALLNQVNSEILSRRQPEYLYTAAAVAAFGAVTWGVATLCSNISMQKSAIVAGIGTLLVAALIIMKIIIEHGHYKKLREEQVQIANKIALTFGINITEFPHAYQNSNAGKGYLYSIAIVALASIASAVFCFNVA